MNLSHEMLLYVNFQNSHWSVYGLGPNSGDLDAGNYIKKRRIGQQLELGKAPQQIANWPTKNFGYPRVTE